MVEPQPEGYAVDRRYPDIFYVPEDCRLQRPRRLRRVAPRRRHQPADAARRTPSTCLPSGFRVRLEKQLGGAAWRLVGSRPRGTLCHKPCTVSGGGKSEISKSIANALLKGPVFVARLSPRYGPGGRNPAEGFLGHLSKPRRRMTARSRPILSPERSLGSVIQLLTPSAEYTDEHNEWLRQLPQTIRQLVFTVKRYYRPEWGDNWREHFTVDRINGFLGHELKFDNQKLVSNYLRVGYDPDGSWRIYKLRPDFYPADKVQIEDDITASVVLPRASLNDLDPEYANPSVKLVANCETPALPAARRRDPSRRRPAGRSRHRQSRHFPLQLRAARPRAGAQAMVDHVVEFDRYTEPMKRLLEDFVAATATAATSSPRRIRAWSTASPPRIRAICRSGPIWSHPREPYLAEIAARLEREIPAGRPVHFPVNAVLAGRRNNPPDPKTRRAAAGGLQSDSLSGTARAVHGVHLQPDRQIARRRPASAAKARSPKARSTRSGRWSISTTRWSPRS